MTEIDISTKFPELKPISGPPSLWTINGCGLSTYGSRDLDEETGTYIKTHCVTLLFVPILALGAYRVAKGEQGGWYFIGREPLSALAKAWNVFIVLALAGGIGAYSWNAQYNSPNAVANRSIASAQEMIANGDCVQAAQTYRRVLMGDSDRIEAARGLLLKMHEDLNVANAPLEQYAEVLDIEIQSRKESSGDPVGLAIFEAGIAAVEKRGNENLQGAAKILKIIEPVAVDAQRYSASRKSVLESLVEQKPDDIALICQLAEVMESLGDVSRCVELLQPHQDKLQTNEGARILGQIYASQGKYEESYGLLKPYCDDRLPKFNAAEQRLIELAETEQQRVFDDLDRGDAPPSFYQRYDTSDEEAQSLMIQNYIAEQLENNLMINEARNSFYSLSGIVPVALDLGMIELRRAQATENEFEQRQGFEEAEKTFHAIQGAVGESDEYLLYMGQVNYWLGKYDEGRDLFDQLLESNQRSYEMLVGVASLVRAVGRETEARKLAEEAYEGTDVVAEKHRAAFMRAAMLKDNDDHIDWLKRADPNDNETKASLSSARGKKAYGKGDYAEAERLIRSSINDYDKLPETTASLNNSGLTFLTLYGITGDQKDFDESLRRLEKAIQREPVDSILRFNTAHGILRAVYNDLVDGRLDMKSTHQTASLDTLRYLYNDQAGKLVIGERLRNHNGMKKAISLYENVIMLSPKKTDSYSTLQAIHEFTRDLESLKKLKQRVESSKPEAEVEERTAFLTGEKDEKYGEMFQLAIDQASKNIDSTKEGTLDHGLAVGTWAMYEVQSSVLEPLDNIDEVVSCCRAAYEAHRCSALRNALQQSILQRAHQRLSEANSDYAALATKGRRTLGGTYMIAVALHEGGELGEIVASDPDVQAACDTIREDVQLFPDSASTWTWAMFRHSDPKFAEQVARKLQTDQNSRVSREIDMLLDPGSLTNALGMYWGHVANGEHEKAKAVIQTYRDTGGEVPLALE